MAVVCYDISDRASFLNTTQWIEDVRAERGSEVVIMLVGNKTDLSDKRQVSVEEGEAKATHDGLLFIETSAKAGYNIKALFRKLASALPGMDSTAAPKTDVLDVVLKPEQTDKETPAENGCGC